MNSPPRYLTGSQLRNLLPGPIAVEALEAGFAERAGSDGRAGSRSVLEHERGDFLSMPAVGPEGAGAKLVTVAPGNPERGMPLINGIYVLFTRDTLTPELLIEGAGMTRLRTAAVSALAARHLANPESRHLVLFGAGAQADAHARMLPELLPIAEVTIVARSAASPRAAELRERVEASGLTARIGRSTDVEAADVVCTCTTATAPVFDGSRLAPGSHVSAVGAYTPAMCELEPELCGRALLVVETLAAARREAGDLIQALASGALREPDFAYELSDLVRGDVRRGDPAQVSVFKSVGLPMEDLILARAAAERLVATPR